MNKMRKLLLGAMLGIAATGMESKLFTTGYAEDPWKNEDDEDRKRRLHKLNPVDQSKREFIVKGERIMAHDKKTAQKIYANRHPETKSKKRIKKYGG